MKGNKLQVTVKTVPPLKPEIESVTLVLSKREAQSLAMLTGMLTYSQFKEWVGGSYYLGKGRNVAVDISTATGLLQNMWASLNNQGISGSKNG